MDNWTFGVTVTVVGMGGTLLILWILSAAMYVLKKIYPLDDTTTAKDKK